MTGYLPQSTTALHGFLFRLRRHSWAVVFATRCHLSQAAAGLQGGSVRRRRHRADHRPAERQPAGQVLFVLPGSGLCKFRDTTTDRGEMVRASLRDPQRRDEIPAYDPDPRDRRHQRAVFALERNGRDVGESRRGA